LLESRRSNPCRHFLNRIIDCPYPLELDLSFTTERRKRSLDLDHGANFNNLPIDADRKVTYARVYRHVPYAGLERLIQVFVASDLQVNGRSASIVNGDDCNIPVLVLYVDNLGDDVDEAYRVVQVKKDILALSVSASDPTTPCLQCRPSKPGSSLRPRTSAAEILHQWSYVGDAPKYFAG